MNARKSTKIKGCLYIILQKTRLVKENYVNTRSDRINCGNIDKKDILELEELFGMKENVGINGDLGGLTGNMGRL